MGSFDTIMSWKMEVEEVDYLFMFIYATINLFT